MGTGEQGRTRPRADILWGWAGGLCINPEITLLRMRSTGSQYRWVFCPGGLASLNHGTGTTNVRIGACVANRGSQRFNIPVHSEDGPLIKLFRSDLRDWFHVLSLPQHLYRRNIGLATNSSG